MKNVIFDTDIGTDVDDALALALAIKSKEINLQAVTTVHGNVELRSKIALKLLRLGGLENVPVASGVEYPLLKDRPILGWSGHEGEGFLKPEDENLRPCGLHAVDLMISKIMSMKKEITLVCVGPLTNLAVAIIREPRIVDNVENVVIMGGVTRLFNGLRLPYREHNILCDPEAAKIVFGSGMPITMVPLDVTLKVYIKRKDLERIRAAKTPIAEAVASMVERYLGIVKRDFTWLHDPLALATLIDESLVEKSDMKILVETRGEYTTGLTLALPPKADEKPIKVCSDVDATRFKNLFMERICAK